MVAHFLRQADGKGPALDHPPGVDAVRGRSVKRRFRSMERKRGVFLSAAITGRPVHHGGRLLAASKPPTESMRIPPRQHLFSSHRTDRYRAS